MIAVAYVIQKFVHFAPESLLKILSVNFVHFIGVFLEESRYLGLQRYHGVPLKLSYHFLKPSQGHCFAISAALWSVLDRCPTSLLLLLVPQNSFCFFFCSWCIEWCWHLWSYDIVSILTQLSVCAIFQDGLEFCPVFFLSMTTVTLPLSAG